MAPDELALVHRGRPRDLSRDQELMDAALGLVAEVGYDRVSMDAVAAACGASKATIYRRWPSKAALIAAAVRCRKPHPSDLPDTGDLRQDLLAGLTRMARDIRDQDVDLLVGLLSAMRTDADLGRDLREQIVLDKREQAAAWTQRGIDRGQLEPGTDLTVIQDIGPALIMTRLLMTGEPIDEQFCAHIVDEVLMPLIAPHLVGPRPVAPRPVAPDPVAPDPVAPQVSDTTSERTPTR